MDIDITSSNQRVFIRKGTSKRRKAIAHVYDGQYTQVIVDALREHYRDERYKRKRRKR